MACSTRDVADARIDCFAFGSLCRSNGTEGAHEVRGPILLRRVLALAAGISAFIRIERPAFARRAKPAASSFVSKTVRRSQVYLRAAVFAVASVHLNRRSCSRRQLSLRDVHRYGHEANKLRLPGTVSMRLRSSRDLPARWLPLWLPSFPPCGAYLASAGRLRVRCRPIRPRCSPAICQRATTRWRHHSEAAASTCLVTYAGCRPAPLRRS